MVQKSSYQPERRSAKRFFVSLPIETDVGPGTTRDVSVSGIYLLCEHLLAVGDRVQLTLTVSNADLQAMNGAEDRGSSAALRLSLAGRVVRVDDPDGAVGAGIALDEGSRFLAQAS
jgi:PilZ domain